jgi:4-nitrophenyl phosphatase
MENNQDFTRLADARCFIFDMDGTVYLGGNLINGVKDFFSQLNKDHFPHFFLTNNSSRSRQDYVEKLEKLGLEVTPEQVFTSGEATAIYLHKQKPCARIYLVGTPSLAQEFKRFGFKLTEKDPDYAVLGFDTTLTYAKLHKLCDLVVAGTPYIATHPDINCPTETGFMPDIGSMIALVEASTGRRPDVVVGKPNPPIIEALLDKTGFTVDELVMVGDRLYTDIAMGQTGITTVLVLSGETKEGDVPHALHKPDYIVRDIGDLHQLYLKFLDKS